MPHEKGQVEKGVRDSRYRIWQSASFNELPESFSQLQKRLRSLWKANVLPNNTY